MAPLPQRDGRQEDVAVKRVITLIDEANIGASARASGLEKMDWAGLAAFLVARRPDRELLDSVVYVGLPPLMEEFRDARGGRERLVHDLRMTGFLVVAVEGTPTGPGHYEANVDVQMALDAMDLAQTAAPDVVVLATGDGDFACLALTLRRRGIRVEVAATARSLGRPLREAASEVIDLEPLFRGLAAGPPRETRVKAGFHTGDGRVAD